MQYTIRFKCDNLKLPIHYNHILQGFIYKNIFDDNFREFLHEKGFSIEGRKFKLFTYSQLFGDYEYNPADKTIIFKDYVRLTVSSIIDNFNTELLKSCFNNRIMELNNQPIKVAGIDVENYNTKINSGIIKTLSPITVYSTIYVNRKKRTIYYSPEDSLFPKLIRQNLIKKAELVYNKPFRDAEFIIKPVEGKVSNNIVYFKKFIVKGSSGIFEIRGNKEIVNIAFNCGLGSKNSQGFGSIKLVKEI